MGGTAKWPARCCSRSDRICQIRPSTKPIAIANEISKAISSTKIIGMFLAQPETPRPVSGRRGRGLGYRVCGNGDSVSEQLKLGQVSRSNRVGLGKTHHETHSRCLWNPRCECRAGSKC